MTVRQSRRLHATSSGAHAGEAGGENGREAGDRKADDGAAAEWKMRGFAPTPTEARGRITRKTRFEEISRREGDSDGSETVKRTRGNGTSPNPNTSASDAEGEQEPRRQQARPEQPVGEEGPAAREEVGVQEEEERAEKVIGEAGGEEFTEEDVDVRISSKGETGTRLKKEVEEAKYRAEEEGRKETKNEEREAPNDPRNERKSETAAHGEAGGKGERGLSGMEDIVKKFDDNEVELEEEADLLPENRRTKSGTFNNGMDRFGETTGDVESAEEEEGRRGLGVLGEGEKG